MPENTIKKKKVNPTIIFLLIFLFIFLLPCFLFAQDRKLEVEYPEIGGIKPETVTSGLPEYVRYIFNLGVIIAGLILFGAIIYGGFLYLTSAGQPVKLQAAKEQILAAFLGVIILLSGYIILTTINPQLVIFPSFKIGKIEICKSDNDCLPGFECKEGNCVAAQKCQKDEDCPGFPDYVCKDKVCVYEGKTLLVYEIPLGQIIKGGVWEENKTKELEKLIQDFENFLKEEIKVNPKFNRIADVNKYLKSLTEECQCGNLDAFCTKPEDWSLPIGCSGDPCKEKSKTTIGGTIGSQKTTREKMEEVLKINEEKIKKLLEFSKKFTEKKVILEKELDKLSRGIEDMMDCLKQSRELYTFKEHLARLQYYEDRGWNVKIVPGPYESYADPFTFYCSVGGPIMDYPYLPKVEFAPEEFKPPDISEKAEKIEPMSCPVEIPIGEILEGIGGLGVTGAGKMDGLIFWIDEMAKEIRDMADLASQCNEQKCSINCACVPNPCYLCCSPTPCTICVPFCKSRCLQAVGICVGSCEIGKIKEKIDDCLKEKCSPEEMEKLYQEIESCCDACPRPEIEVTVAKIKSIEDEIFAILKEGKEIFPKVNEIVKVGAEDAIDLKDISKAVELCHGPLTETEPPAWFMLSCPLALGSYGPGSAIIGGCHPWNYFCCTASKEALTEMPSFPLALQKPRPAAAIGPETPEEPLPSELAKSSIPPLESSPFVPGQVSCLKQSDFRWGQELFGCPPAGTYSKAGCGPSSLAMAISYFQGKEIPVNAVGQEIIKKGFRVCGSGTDARAVAAIPSIYGLDSYEIKPFAFENWKKEVEKCFDGGGLIIALMRGPSKFTSGSGHYITLTEITDDYAYVTVNDSSKISCPRQESLKDVYAFKKNPGIWCINK